MKKATMKVLWMLVLSTILAGCATKSSSGKTVDPKRVDRAQDVVDKSSEVLASFLERDPTGDLGNIISESYGIFVFPDVIKAAFLFGAEGGDGVLSVKREGKWRGPALYSIGSTGVGFQAGIRKAKMLVIISDESALEGFLHQGISLGGSADIALIDFTEHKQSSKLSNSGGVSVVVENEGLFGGVSVQGLVVSPGPVVTGALHGMPELDVETALSPDGPQSGVGNAFLQVLENAKKKGGN